MKKKILVFEKNKDILDMIGIILNEEGYSAELVSSEKEVKQRINDFKPDAILLDVISPTAEGTALCKAIKSAEDTSHPSHCIIYPPKGRSGQRDLCRRSCTQAF